MRRAPLLQRGGWGFESFTADTPLKLSSAEQPPRKRTVVGSIPTWGSSPPRSPTWQRHPAQTRTSRGSSPRGGLGVGASMVPHRPRGRGATATVPKRQSGPPPRRLAVCHTPSIVRCDVVQTAGRPAVTRRTLFDPSRRSSFPGRPTAGSSALNRGCVVRIPPEELDHADEAWRPCGFQHRRRGFDSFRGLLPLVRQVRALPGSSWEVTGRRGAWPPHRLRASEIAGSNPADQTFALRLREPIPPSTSLLAAVM